MRLHLVVLLAALLAGCTGLGTRQPDRYYILAAGPAREAALHSRIGIDATPTTAASFYDTQDIVFSRSPGTRGYYQFNHWTERPQEAIHAQLVARLDTANADRAYLLATQVDEIYHDAVQPPGRAYISMSAELVDPTSRRVLTKKKFTRSAPAGSFDASGAVRGFDEALDGLLDDIVAWIDAEAASRQLAQRSASD
ncbi:MAG TPA: ABC-type transport auxiliary lipoprotein family protein [Casimicrobiaceae bacterium]|nr:ABC-type transport auxiliary lipoprotein family protein [Casimicrobiaceae bacterium]